jgi:uncharacterized protein (DUF488 family)
VSPVEIFTVGHSTRSLAELVRILQDSAVRVLVDVRTAPGSRRHPHFDREVLAVSLQADGINYHHEPALGGFRRPRPDSPNGGWEQRAFRGYADHMASDEFRAALERVERLARDRVVCLMCAEARGI